MPFNTWNEFMNGLSEDINDIIMEYAIPKRKEYSDAFLLMGNIHRNYTYCPNTDNYVEWYTRDHPFPDGQVSGSTWMMEFCDSWEWDKIFGINITFLTQESQGTLPLLKKDRFSVMFDYIRIFNQVIKSQMERCRWTMLYTIDNRYYKIILRELFIQMLTRHTGIKFRQHQRNKNWCEHWDQDFEAEICIDYYNNDHCTKTFGFCLTSGFEED